MYGWNALCVVDAADSVMAGGGIEKAKTWPSEDSAAIVSSQLVILDVWAPLKA